MDEDRFGLRALYTFQIGGNSLSNMTAVRNQLGEILQAVQNLTDTTASAAPRLGRDLGQMGSQSARGTQRAASTMNQLAQASKSARDRLVPLKSEFRALRAASRNIDFGDIADDEQFKRATREVNSYVRSLKSLQRQIQGDTAAEREFAETLKSQQAIAKSRVDIGENQRKAARAAEKVGISQSIQGAGKGVLNMFETPLKEAEEYAQQLGSIYKLADFGENKTAEQLQKAKEELKNSITNYSTATATAREDVSGVIEDFASGGKSFEDMGAINAELEQVLKNAKALDITADKASTLDIQLGLTYQASLERYGGIVKLNQRVGSAINTVADNVANVKISAEQAAPVISNLFKTIGDSKSMKAADIVAFGSILSSIDVEPAAASAFIARLNTSISKAPDKFASSLGLTMEEFNEKLNNDKLGVIQDIAKAYKSFEGDELKQGAFLGKAGLGISQSGDQAVIKGLGNAAASLSQAREFANKQFEEGTSVNREFNNLLGQTAFQSKKASVAVDNLSVTLASLLDESLLPFKKAMGDVLTTITAFVQKYPGITKVVIVSVYAFASLAVAVGGIGVILFGFQQAAATAGIAATALGRSVIPLTGFYESSLAAFTATNPLVGGLTAIKALALDLVSPLGAVSEAIAGIAAAALTPIGIFVTTLSALYLIAEIATPQLNVLGAVLGAIAAPIGFLTGLIKGLIVGALEPFFRVFGSGFAKSLSAPFGILIDALSVAAKTFAAFSNQGESIGQAIGNNLVSPFLWAGSRIVSLWSKTVGVISNLLKPLADVAAVVGRLMLASLAENSPGLTWLLRHIWEFTVWFIKGLLFDLPKAAARVGADMFAHLSAAFEKLRNFATQTWADIQPSLQSAINGATLASIDVISMLAGEFERLPGLVSSVWTQIRAVSQNAINGAISGGIDIVSTLASEFERLQITASSSWSGIQTASQGVINGAMMGGIDTISMLASELERLPGVASTVWGQVKKSSQDAINGAILGGIDVVSTLASEFEILQTTALGVWGDIQKNSQDAINGAMLSGIDMVSMLASEFERLQNIVLNVWTQIQTASHNKINDAMLGGIDAISSLMSSFESLQAKAASVFNFFGEKTLTIPLTGIALGAAQSENTLPTDVGVGENSGDGVKAGNNPINSFVQAIADIPSTFETVKTRVAQFIADALVTPFNFATESAISFTLELLDSFEYLKDYVKVLRDPDVSGLQKIGETFNYFLIKPLDTAFTLLNNLKKGMIANFGVLESILLVLSTIPLSLVVRNVLYLIPASLVETGSIIAAFMGGPMTAFAYLLPIMVASAIGTGLVTHVGDAIVNGIKSAVLFSISELPPILYSLSDAFAESFSDTDLGKNIAKTFKSIGLFLESLGDEAGPVEKFFNTLDEASNAIKGFYGSVLKLADTPVLFGKSFLDIFQGNLVIKAIFSLLSLGALDFVKPVLGAITSIISSWYTLVTSAVITMVLSAANSVGETIKYFGKAAADASMEAATQASTAVRATANALSDSAKDAIGQAFTKSKPVLERSWFRFSSAFIAYIEELPFGKSVILPLMRGFGQLLRFLLNVGKAIAVFSYNFILSFVRILPVKTILNDLTISLKGSFGEIVALLIGGFTNTFTVVAKIASLFKYLNPNEFMAAYKETQGFLTLGYKYLTPFELLLSEFDDSIKSIRKAKLSKLIGRALPLGVDIYEVEKGLAVWTRLTYSIANWSVAAGSIFALISVIGLLGYALLKSGLAAQISITSLSMLGSAARHSGDAAFYLFGQLGKVIASIPLIQKISNAIAPVANSISAITDSITGFFNDNFYDTFSKILDIKDAINKFIRNLVGSFIVGLGVLFAVVTLFYARMNPLRIFEGISKAFKALVIKPIVGTVGAIKGLISSIVELTKVLTPLGITFAKSGRQSEQFQLDLDQTSLTIGKQGGMVKRLARLFRVPVTPEFDLERMQEQMPRKRELAGLYESIKIEAGLDLKQSGVVAAGKNKYGKPQYSQEQINTGIENILSDQKRLRSLAFSSGGKQINQMAKTNQVDALRMLFTDKGKEQFLEGGETALREMNLRAEKVELSADFLNAKTKATTVSGTLIEVNSGRDKQQMAPLPGILAGQRNISKDSVTKFGLAQSAVGTSYSDALGRRSNDQLGKWATEFGAKIPEVKSLSTMDDKQLLAFLKKNYSITAAAQSLTTGAVTGLNSDEIEKILGVSIKDVFTGDEFKKVDQRTNLTPVELDQKEKRKSGLLKNIYLDSLALKGKVKTRDDSGPNHYDYLRELKNEPDDTKSQDSIEKLRVLKRAVYAQESELYESTKENLLKIIDVISADTNVSFGNLTQSDIRRQSKTQLIEKILQEKAAYQNAFQALSQDAIRMGELADSVRDLALNLPVPPPVKPPATKGFFGRNRQVEEVIAPRIEDVRAEKLTARAFDVGFDPTKLARLKNEASFLRAFVETKIAPNATDQQAERELLNQIGDVREVAKSLGIAYDVAGSEREQEVSALRGLMNSMIESLHEAKVLSRRELLDHQADIQSNLGGAIKYMKEGDMQFATDARKYQLEREARGGMSAIVAQAIPIPQQDANEATTEASLKRRARVTKLVEQGQLEELPSTDLLAIAKAARMNVVELLRPDLPDINKGDQAKTGVLRRQFVRSRMSERGIGSSQDLINQVFESFRKDGVNVTGGKDALQRDFAAILQGRSFDVDTARLQRFAEILSMTGRKASDAAIELEAEISSHSLLASQLNATNKATTGFFKDLRGREVAVNLLATQYKEEEKNRANLEKQRMRGLMGLAYEFTGKDPKEYLQQNNIPVKELVTGTLEADQPELERIAGLLKTTVSRLQSLEKYRTNPRTERAINQFEIQYKDQQRLAEQQARLTPEQVLTKEETAQRVQRSQARTRQTILTSEQFVAPTGVKGKEAAQAQFEKVKAELVNRFQVEAGFIDQLVAGQIKSLEDLSDTEQGYVEKIAQYANVRKEDVISKRQFLVPGAEYFNLKKFMSKTSTIEQFETARSHLVNQLGIDSDFIDRLLDGKITFATELTQIERKYVSEIAKYANVTENDIFKMSEFQMLPGIPITQNEKSLIKLKNKFISAFGSLTNLGKEYNQQVNTSLSHLMKEAGYGTDFNLLVEILRTEGVKTSEIQALFTGPDKFRQQIERDRKKAQRTISKTLQDLLYDNNEAVRIAFKGTGQEAIAALQQVGVAQEKIDFLVGKAHPGQKTATEVMNLSDEAVRVISDVFAIDPDKLKQAYTIKTPRGGFGAFLVGKGAQFVRKKIDDGLDSIKGLISAQYRQAAADMETYQRSLSQEARAKRKAAAKRDAAILREIAAEILKFGARGQLNWLSQNAAEQAYQLGAVVNKYRGKIPGAGLLEDSIYKMGRFLGKEARAISTTIDNLPSIGQRFVALKQKIVDSLTGLMTAVSTKYQEGIQAVNKATEAVKSYTPNWLKVAVSKIWKYTIGGLASFAQKTVKGIGNSMYEALPATKRRRKVIAEYKATTASRKKAIADSVGKNKAEGAARQAAMAAMDAVRLSARRTPGITPIPSPQLPIQPITQPLVQSPSRLITPLNSIEQARARGLAAGEERRQATLALEQARVSAITQERILHAEGQIEQLLQQRYALDQSIQKEEAKIRPKGSKKIRAAQEAVVQALVKQREVLEQQIAKQRQAVPRNPVSPTPPARQPLNILEQRRNDLSRKLSDIQSLPMGDFKQMAVRSKQQVAVESRLADVNNQILALKAEELRARGKQEAAARQAAIASIDEARTLGQYHQQQIARLKERGVREGAMRQAANASLDQARQADAAIAARRQNRQQQARDKLKAAATLQQSAEVIALPEPPKNIYAESQKALANLVRRSAEKYAQRQERLASQMPDVTVNRPKQLYSYTKVQRDESGQMTGYAPLTGTRGVTQETYPSQGKATYLRLANSARETSAKIAQFFEQSAAETEANWQSTGQKISGRMWKAPLAAIYVIGHKIQKFFSEGSPGPSFYTRQNWEHTADSVQENLAEVATTASRTGKQVQSSMVGAATHAANAFTRIRGAVTSVGRAGMKMGGVVTASGMAAQTIAFSLSNLGILDEETSQALYKFTEIFTVVGAIGGLAIPILGAVGSALGAILTVGGLIVGTVFSPIGLGIAATGVGLLVLNAAIRKLTGINILGRAFESLSPKINSVFDKMKMAAGGALTFIDGIWTQFVEQFGSKLAPIVQPVFDMVKPLFTYLTNAAGQIQSAWQGFVNWFSAMPLVAKASEIAQGLISALNCYPTIKIPEAWNNATEKITGFLQGLLKVGITIGAALIGALGINRLKTMGSLFSSMPIDTASVQRRNDRRNKVVGISNKVEKFSLYANASNDIAELSGIEMPEFVDPLLKVTTIVGVMGDLGTEIIPGMIKGMGKLKTGMGKLKTKILALRTGVIGLNLSMGVIAGVAIGIGAAVAGLYLIWSNNLFGIQEKTAHAIAQIQSAWQGFVDWFSTIPLVDKAVEIAQGLISALNCHPTEVIPLAWEGAVSRITQWLSGLPIIGGLISGELIKSFDPSRIFAGFWEQAKKLSKFFPWMKGEVAQIPEAPAAPVAPPEPTKDYQTELRRAIGIAKAQQDQNAIESLQAIASTAQGQLTPSQYAAVTAPESQVGGGALLAGEVKLTEQREARDRVFGNLQTLGSFAVGKSDAAQAKNSIKGLIKETTGGAMLLEKTGTNFKSASGEIAGKIEGIDRQIAQAGTQAGGMGGIFGMGKKIDTSSLQIQKEGLIEQMERDFSSVLSDQQRQFLVDVGISPDGIDRVIDQISGLTTNVQNEFGDRWLALQRSNGDAVRDIFEPGIAQMKDGFSLLGGDVSDFVKRSAKALFTLNFNELGQAAKDFGGNAIFALGMIKDGFGSASLSAIAFGVYSLLSLNPLLLILGGIALGALAIAFNFLGIRTIIGGLIEIVKGVVKLFVSTIQLAIQLGRAFRTIAEGVFTLDFDLIRRGTAQAFGAIGSYVQRLRESLTSILGGAISVVNGLFQGLGQIGNTVLGAIGFKSTFIGNAFNNVIGSVGYLGSALMTLVTKPQALWQKLKNLLDEIWDKLKSIREKAVSVKDKVSESLGNVGNSIKDSSLGQGVRAVKKRLKGESPTMADAKAAVDFEQKLKGKEPRVAMGDRVMLAKSSVNDFVGGMFGRKKKSEPIEVPVVPAPLPTPNKKPEPIEVPVIQVPLPVSNSVKTPVAQATENAKATKESRRLARQQQRDLEQATKKAEQEQRKKEDAFAASRNALGSMGSVMGALVPQLAVPIMALDAVTNAFANMPDAIKESKEAVSSLKAAFPGVVDAFSAFNSGAREMWSSLVSGYTSGGIIGAIQSLYQFLAVKLFAKTASAQATAVEAAIEVPANTAIAASEQTVAVAATQAGVAQVNSAIASSGAATTEAQVVGGANGFMALTYKALSGAAVNAWKAITGPLLPVIATIGLLILVVGGIYLAFKTNFAGIGSLFGAFWNSLKQLGSSIMTLFSPLMPLIKLIGGLFIVALLSPVLLIVGALTLVIQGINAVVQGVIAIASTAFKFLWNLIPQPLRWLLEKAAQGIGFAINALFGGDKGAQEQTEELPQFAVGGPVSANKPGGPVAAILHDNEFVMNPNATRENYGLLQLLNSGVSAEDAIRMIPTTPPELVMPTGGSGGNGAATTGATSESPKIELNIMFTGNIVLGGNNDRENAREFMNMIGPEIEELVVEAMRQRGEFSR